MFRCVVIVALISLVSGFVHTNGLNRNSLIRRYASSDQQEVQDLNLEEMFDVFEAGTFPCSPVIFHSLIAIPITAVCCYSIKYSRITHSFTYSYTADKTVSSSAIPKGQSGSKFDFKKQVGSSAPLAYFDPVGFTNDVTEEQYKLYQGDY